MNFTQHKPYWCCRCGTERVSVYGGACVPCLQIMQPKYAAKVYGKGITDIVIDDPEYEAAIHGIDYAGPETDRFYAVAHSGRREAMIVVWMPEKLGDKFAAWKRGADSIRDFMKQIFGDELFECRMVMADQRGNPVYETTIRDATFSKLGA